MKHLLNFKKKREYHLELTNKTAEGLCTFQGSTICVRRVHTYAYFFGVCMILDMRTLTRELIFPYDFLKFSGSYNFM